MSFGRLYARLTNNYCIVAQGPNENFYSVFEAELADRIPVVKSTIGGTSLIGSCTVGNSKGLLVSSTTTDQELQHLRNCLPESVKIQRVEERLSALGNVIACNDYVGLIHMDLDRETEEIAQDVLGIELFRTTINNEVLVGQYSVLTNRGGIVHAMTSKHEVDALSQMLQIPLAAGTINGGSDLLAAGVVVNDWAAFVGQDSTFAEMSVVEQICAAANRS
ncbi:eukaryotic translation initiation factor 6 [Gregarina niphandrodes]|uniref:Eukaryotic translation initiation factor 6 n=1 Tax=Gregarina niphandrodes TaxID=110365 RepID=A0A023B8S1_GRENI|nr:eukaryotic translation initiation factor 6 [Gregarina niphandrodes]EZG70147.1 eukaryotic translation initiation factor 6 [Gregarina niphandrodes]|eukprot:XP_011129981.1 eukaryotic translation initiation factor 6 [Gregarina niphandrodes]